MDSPLPELVDGHWHHVRLRLSNELGLFSAETFGAQAACTVRLWALPCEGVVGPHVLDVRQAAEPTAEPTADAARTNDRGAHRRRPRRVRGARAIGRRLGWPTAPRAVVLMAEPLAAADEDNAAPLGCLSLPPSLADADYDEPTLSMTTDYSDDEMNTARAADAVVRRVGAALREDNDAAAAPRLRVLLLPGRPPLVLAESAADIYGKVGTRGSRSSAGSTTAGDGDARGARSCNAVHRARVGRRRRRARGSRARRRPPRGRAHRPARGDGAAAAQRARANDGALTPPPRVAPLAWGDADAARAVLDDAFGTGAAPDLVLCSDVVYDPDAYEPLLTTLCALARAATPPPRVWMGHRSRHPQEHEFWAAAAASFDVEVLRGPVPFTPLGAGDGADAMPRLLELRWRGMHAAAVLSELLE